MGACLSQADIQGFPVAHKDYPFLGPGNGSVHDIFVCIIQQGLANWNDNSIKFAALGAMSGDRVGQIQFFDLLGRIPDLPGTRELDQYGLDGRVVHFLDDPRLSIENLKVIIIAPSG